MNLNFQGAIENLPFILQGISTTLTLVLASIICGVVLGMLLSLAKLSKNKFLSALTTVYISIFRGTPLVLQLVLIYFGLPQMFGIDLGSYGSAILALSLNSAAYVSEIIRSGIMAVDKGQTEAAEALGVPYSKMMKNIILPQAIKNILPALINEFTALTKESAIVTVVGTADIMRRSQMVAAQTFLYFETLLIAGAIYYVIVTVISFIGKTVERRLSVSG